ncbi:MAG TPA: dihydropteroate synthase-like protein [Methanothrix sp.]|nr:dihydropteroate synthase-like protein [Methanothrix sp.]
MRSDTATPARPERVLLVTGRLAKEQVIEAARCFGGGAEVLVADLDVAAFITPQMLLLAAPRGYDLILIAGSVTADFREVEEELKTPVRLGPKHAADIRFVLDHLHDFELSTTVPACVLMQERLRRDALSLVERLEEQASWLMKVRGRKVGGGSRMKVLAEIVDAARLTPAALADRIRYYEEQGADMIDLGLSLDANCGQVEAAVGLARRATDLPISIDTLRPDLILSGIRAGVDLVLSLDGGNLPLVGEAVAHAGLPAVVISGPGPASLEENLAKAASLGISAIADPVLEPPLLGLAASLNRYLLFHESHPSIPLFFGAGNVTELLDADTGGVNALLAALSAEVGGSILFTPEYSAKAAGSVGELATASRMMLLAGSRRSPPKDLGLDGLVLKEKRRLAEEPMPADAIDAQAGQSRRFMEDGAGSFRIFISGERIVAQNAETAISGKSAKSILNAIIDRRLVSRLDHAGYLGRELERAETALRLKRGYIQDEPLWPAEKS